MFGNCLWGHTEPRLLVKLDSLVKFLKEIIAFIPKFLDYWIAALIFMFLDLFLHLLGRFAGLEVYALYFTQNFASMSANHHQLIFFEGIYGVKASLRFGLFSEIFLIFFLHVVVLVFVLFVCLIFFELDVDARLFTILQY